MPPCKGTEYRSPLPLQCIKSTKLHHFVIAPSRACLPKTHKQAQHAQQVSVQTTQKLWAIHDRKLQSKKGALVVVFFAVLGKGRDLALVVLPVPGGPSNSTARGLLFAKWRRVPLAMVSYTSGCSRASSMVSSICCF